MSLELNMTGMELSKAFYEAYGKPMLEKHFSKYLDKITVGLVGEGSECFGFDDRLSMDHDYGPSFCMWLSQDLYQEIGMQLSNQYNALPKAFMGVAYQTQREQSAGRRGVIRTSTFYQKFLGRDYLPSSSMEWLRMPEQYLSVATNGTIFQGTDTEFLTIRNYLLQFYPEDVRKKKIAKNLIQMAHCGQVNMTRMTKRNDPVAAAMARNQFIEATLLVVYLLNKSYAPYYKWMWRGLQNLKDDFGASNLVRELSLNPALDQRNVDLCEEICSLIRSELSNQELTFSASDYMEHHAVELYQTIEDPDIRRLPIMVG